MEHKTPICWVMVLEPNGTYLEKDSILPAHINDELQLVVTEEYEPGCQCEHLVDDLKSDGVVLVRVGDPF